MLHPLRIGLDLHCRPCYVLRTWSVFYFILALIAKVTPDHVADVSMLIVPTTDASRRILLARKLCFLLPDMHDYIHARTEWRSDL